MASKIASRQEEDGEKETHFGFQIVKESEKSKRVHNIFDKMAPDYDKVLDAISMGISRIWKNRFMSRWAPTENTNLIDVASGTGDIAFRFLDYVKNNNVEKTCHVTLCDFSANMLEVAKARSKALGYDPKLISFKQTDTENLDFPNDSFNTYAVSFGLRYCIHIDKALKEAYRVLQPGGRFLCLEVSKVHSSIYQWFFDKYSFFMVPLVGPMVSGQPETYQFFLESIKQFPNQETFKKMIEDAGFQNVTYENVFLGMAAIHTGYKPL